MSVLKIQWIKHREKNIKFFHAFANARRRKSPISKVEFNGRTLENIDDIKEAFTLYHKQLFSKATPTDFRID